MNKLNSFIENVVANVAANVVILAATAVLGAAVALYSNNLQTGLLATLVILVGVNVLLSFVLLRGQVASSNKEQLKVSFCRDIQNKTTYLIDMNNRAREIPDDENDTFSFLVNALGFIGELPTMPSNEIARLRGEKLSEVNKWRYERPRTLEEAAQEEIWHSAVKSLRKTKSNFVFDSDPQKIAIEITNVGNKPLFLKGVKFQHDKLLPEDLDASYPKENILTIVKINQTYYRNYMPGDHFWVEMHLSRKFETSSIELNKGQWGCLRLDLTYDGKQVNHDVIINI